MTKQNRFPDVPLVRAVGIFRDKAKPARIDWVPVFIARTELKEVRTLGYKDRIPDSPCIAQTTLPLKMTATVASEISGNLFSKPWSLNSEAQHISPSVFFKKNSRKR